MCACPHLFRQPFSDICCAAAPFSAADVVFFIFLYQRYIYRVDPSRVNEFGFSQEMLERKQAEAAAAGAERPAGEGAAALEKTPGQKKED